MCAHRFDIPERVIHNQNSSDASSSEDHHDWMVSRENIRLPRPNLYEIRIVEDDTFSSVQQARTQCGVEIYRYFINYDINKSIKSPISHRKFREIFRCHQECQCKKMRMATSAHRIIVL